MLERQKGGVFLSYARQDGENFAQELRTRLRREASDIVIKQDRIFLEGGLGWWKQITEAIVRRFLGCGDDASRGRVRQRTKGMALCAAAGRLCISVKGAPMRNCASPSCRGG